MGLLGTILVVILILLLIGALPASRHNPRYGWGLGGLGGAILIVVIILLLLGRF